MSNPEPAFDYLATRDAFAAFFYEQGGVSVADAADLGSRVTHLICTKDGMPPYSHESPTHAEVRESCRKFASFLSTNAPDLIRAKRS